MSDGIITTDILRRDERGAVAAVTVDRTATLNVVNGAMCRDLGGGLEIAAACDFRIAASDACMGMPEVQVGSLR
jgi:enoyl-CoA hydratase/carnithine racemase